jgi:hypothetical protein
MHEISHLRGTGPYDLDLVLEIIKRNLSYHLPTVNTNYPWLLNNGNALSEDGSLNKILNGK